MGIFHLNSGRPATLVIPVLRDMGVSLIEGEITFTRFNSILRIEFVLEKDFSNLLGIVLISKRLLCE